MIQSNLNAAIGVMIHTGTGNIPVDEILDATREWFGHPNFDARAPVVWDLSDAFLDMSIEEMRQMYSLVRGAVDSKRAGGRTGWVHPSGLVRSMISLIHDEFEWGSEWETFQVVDEAIAWCLDAHEP